MALIKCSECGKEVSDKAAACPSCGNPVNNAPEPTTVEQKPVEIELTSKRWKKVHIVSWVMIMGGLILMGKDAQHGLEFWFGVNLIFFGIIVRYVGKLGAWWTNR